MRDDFHLQGEVDGRLPVDTSTVVEPGESPLPLSFNLRSGLRRGAWTLRNSLGVSAGGQAAHVPLRAHGSPGVALSHGLGGGAGAHRNNDSSIPRYLKHSGLKCLFPSESSV
jgi:hypothetical protein